MTINDRYIYTNAYGTVSVIIPAPQWFESMIRPAEYDPVTGELVLEAVTEQDCWDIILEKEKKKHALDIVAKQKLDEGLTHQEASAYIQKNHKDIAPVDIPDIEKIPDTAVKTDRTFRNAWKKGVGKIEVDIPKAKELAKEKVREARAPKLAELDGQWFAKQGKPAEVAAVEAKKQKLRDATDDVRINNAATEEDLKAGMEAVIAEVKTAV